MMSVCSYPLDNSAIIHLAARKRNHTNTFRISITLKETVHPDVLQKAVERITPRFPTLLAGIRPGIFQYRIVPVHRPPEIEPDQECLAPMKRRQFRNCGVRILYRYNQISAEIFHSLTDGYGGVVFLTTLVAEYLRIQYSAAIPSSEVILDKSNLSPTTEISDDYITYAHRHGTSLKYNNVFQLPGHALPDQKVLITIRHYDANIIQSSARKYGVSVTAFLSAVMIDSVREIQKRNSLTPQKIQIMVPVNLRRLFRSNSLRNFSLFALIGTDPTENMSFEELAYHCGRELAHQNTKEFMGKAIAANVNATRSPLYRLLPLPLKWLILRWASHVFGEGNSCISLSNLGVIHLPEDMQVCLERMEFALTPRDRSLYNCGVVTNNDVLSIQFSRSCREPELESLFFTKLECLLST